MATFVPAVRTGQGQQQAAWIRERWGVLRNAALGVGLTGAAAERAAAQSCALWLVATGPANEWNWNPADLECDVGRGSAECYNNGTRTGAAYRNLAAAAADWWDAVQGWARTAGVDFVRWMGTLDASAVYAFDRAMGGAALPWSQVVNALRTVANATSVSGWSFPAAPGEAPAEFRRGASTGGGSSTGTGGGSSTGGRTPGTTGTSTGGGGSGTSTGGGSTDVVGAANDYSRAVRGGSGSKVALLALLALGLAMDSKKPAKGKR